LHGPQPVAPSNQTCWEKVRAIKKYNLLTDIILRVGTPPPIELAEFFRLAALETCNAAQIEEFMQSATKATHVDQVARNMWLTALKTVESTLKNQTRPRPWDTRTMFGMTQTLRQSELRAVTWHLVHLQKNSKAPDTSSLRWHQTCEDHTNYIAKCALWASNGECEQNPRWMKDNCCASCKSHKLDLTRSNNTLLHTGGNKLYQTVKATLTCADAAKYKERCKRWAPKGCTKQPGFMSKWCCASCMNTNPGTINCHDSHLICKWWSEHTTIRHCDQGFIRKMCPSSCNVCT